MDNRREEFTPDINGLSQQQNAKLLNMIFIVDTSGSMMGERIGAVNEAFTQMIPALRQAQMDCGNEFELKISIMKFDYNAEWLVNPTPIMEYNHNDIDCSKWQTMYGKAYEALNEKLTRDEFMSHVGKIAQPYIMFMTDGEPTDDDYDLKLDNLLKNGWFTNSQRFAVLMGKDAIDSQRAKEAVARFVSNPVEGIINAADAATIAAEVQARTLHTIQIQTGHALPSMSDENDDTDLGGNDVSSNPDGGGFGGFGDFGGFGGSDVYDNGTFI